MSRNRKRRSKSITQNNNQNNQRYIPVYSKEQYDNDVIKFENALKNGMIDKNTFKRIMTQNIASNIKIIDNSEYLGHLKIDEIKHALRHPKHSWRILLALSEELMHISPQYYRLNMFFSNMAVFCWGVDTYDIKEKADINKLKTSYSNLALKLESMNLKHEFTKIMRYLPYQDIFCGLVVESNSDFFIQQINFKMCKLYQVQDGLYNFVIDLSKINLNNLAAFPDYVQSAYKEFITNPSSGNWYYPPADKQICVKFNSQWLYPFPVLISLIDDILDLDIYKKLKLQSARTDNYKAIMVKVPIDESMVDKPLLTPETLGIFAEINRESMTDDIGLIHTLGSTGEAISFKDSNNTRNNVADAIENIYDDSGQSKELYNGSSSATALTFSIENDSGFIYSLYRQFERWVNRFIKLRNYNKSLYKFSFYLLDTTIFNRDNIIKRYKESCTLGVPVVDKFLSSLDMTPAKVLGSFVLHEKIFDYKNHFIPLTSTYNSSSNEAGRPTNASKGELLDVSGEQTANSDANADR